MNIAKEPSIIKKVKHKVATIKLNDPEGIVSVNSVRGSIVNYKARAGAMSTDKVRPTKLGLSIRKSPERPTVVSGRF